MLTNISGGIAMNYMDCDAELVDGLIDLVTTAQVACSISFDANDELCAVVPPGVALGDIESVIDALHVLRPRVIELSIFDALMHIVRGQWREATQTLYEAVTLRPDFQYGKAMLAFCLSQQNDSAWRPVAQEVLASGDSPDAVRFVRAFDEYISVRDGVPPLAASVGAVGQGLGADAQAVDAAPDALVSSAGLSGVMRA
ncbi:HrpB1 family type III secretion system apparatus protein [Trinickia sp. LjRoot230]|uniref:HrpB1 family type III secretion system apparatus protein n=1 Tax=Trinickia sp. LjRoot230 TaxID=3342288 RepID=UPI003ECC44FA